MVSVALVCWGLILAPPTARATPRCATVVDMLIVLDATGSMGMGKPTFWQQATSAVEWLVEEHARDMRIGLILFPRVDSDLTCDPGRITVPLRLSAEAAITRAMAAVVPAGATPLAETLDQARLYYAKVKATIPRYVLLISDGDDSCLGEPVSAVERLRAAGVRTFVVGFGDGLAPDVLRDMALAGGAPRAGSIPFFEASDAASLRQALAAVGSYAACCGNGIIDEGETCDIFIPRGKPGACPLTCNDQQLCTRDERLGTLCTASCRHTPITRAVSGDGCCLPGHTAAQDSDCRTEPPTLIEPDGGGVAAVGRYQGCDCHLSGDAPDATPLLALPLLLALRRRDRLPISAKKRHQTRNMRAAMAENPRQTP